MTAEYRLLPFLLGLAVEHCLRGALQLELPVDGRVGCGRQRDRRAGRWRRWSRDDRARKRFTVGGFDWGWRFFGWHLRDLGEAYEEYLLLRFRQRLGMHHRVQQEDRYYDDVQVADDAQ